MRRYHTDTIPYRHLIISAGVEATGWLALLEAQGCRAGECAAQLLEGVELECPTSIELARVSVADLGFDDCVCLRSIYARACRQGLRLCPAATGPCLRMQLLDQLDNDWLYIGMKPLRDRDGAEGIFELDNAFDAPWLRGFSGNPKKRFHPRDNFVFAVSGNSEPPQA